MAINNGRFLFVVIVLAAVFGIVTLLMRQADGKSRPALVAKPLLTAREQAMLEILETLLPTCRLHAQVAMGALIRVKPQFGRSVTAADRNSFSQKIVDFVVQDRISGQVVALIEVDDSSHKTSVDKVRDLMTAEAGYTTIRIAGRARPNVADLSTSLAPLMPYGANPKNG